MKKYVLIIILLFVGFYSYSQSDAYIDSLVQVVENEKEDTLKIKTLYVLLNYTIYNSPDRFDEFYNQTIDLSKKANYRHVS